MSAWGAGTFENDSALTWIGDLLKSKDASLVRATLNRVVEYNEKLPTDLATQALAAAEIVAAWHRQPLINLPYEVAVWLERNRSSFETELIVLARQAVAVVKTDSKLKELWGEGNASQWLAAVTDLEQRLSD